MKVARTHHATTSSDNRYIIVIGGYGRHGSLSGCAVLDTYTGRWADSGNGSGGSGNNGGNGNGNSSNGNNGGGGDMTMARYCCSAVVLVGDDVVNGHGDDDIGNNNGKDNNDTHNVNSNSNVVVVSPVSNNCNNNNDNSDSVVNGDNNNNGNNDYKSSTTKTTTATTATTTTTTKSTSVRLVILGGTDNLSVEGIDIHKLLSSPTKTRINNSDSNNDIVDVDDSFRGIGKSPPPPPRPPGTTTTIIEPVTPLNRISTFQEEQPQQPQPQPQQPQQQQQQSNVADTDIERRARKYGLLQPLQELLQYTPTTTTTTTTTPAATTTKNNDKYNKLLASAVRRFESLGADHVDDLIKFGLVEGFVLSLRLKIIPRYVFFPLLSFVSLLVEGCYINNEKGINEFSKERERESVCVCVCVCVCEESLYCLFQYLYFLFCCYILCLSPYAHVVSKGIICCVIIVISV